MTSETEGRLEESVGITRQVHVHYDDLDYFGVLHNSRYSLLIERAIVSYWAEQGMGLVDGRRPNPDTAIAVSEFNIRYLRPITSIGPVDLNIWIDRMGKSSRVFGFRFLTPDHQSVYAQGSRTTVTIGLATGRPVSMSADDRKISESLTRGATQQ